MCGTVFACTGSKKRFYVNRNAREQMRDYCYRKPLLHRVESIVMLFRIEILGTVHTPASAVETQHCASTTFMSELVSIEARSFGADWSGALLVALRTSMLVCPRG